MSGTGTLEITCDDVIINAVNSRPRTRGSTVVVDVVVDVDVVLVDVDAEVTSVVDAFADASLRRPINRRAEEVASLVVAGFFASPHCTATAAADDVALVVVDVEVIGSVCNDARLFLKNKILI